MDSSDREERGGGVNQLNQLLQFQQQQQKAFEDKKLALTAQLKVLL